MKPEKFTDADVADQSGRTFLVTGANTGLGFEVARVLARAGGRVLLACRNADKAQDAMERIARENAGADLDFVSLDQAHLASVRAAAERVRSEDRLDVLINNAGIMYAPKSYTQDGFESQFGVNHLGTFALTGLLLDKLMDAPDGVSDPRVVTTSSIAHTMNAKIYFGDLDASKKYNAFRRYNQSKLANMLFGLELDRRLRAKSSRVKSVVAHPGVANTELPRYMPKVAQALIGPMSGFLNSPLQGAWPTLAAAVGDGVEGGDYYGPDGFMEWRGKATTARIAPYAKDPALSMRLWERSVEMTGVDPKV